MFSSFNNNVQCIPCTDSVDITPSRPSSSHPSRRPTSKRVYRRLHSPTTSDTVSSRSSVTQTTSTSDMEQLPPASRRQRKKSSSQQSVSSRRSDQDRDRPVSSKYRTRTIINVPEVRFQEGVSVQDTTQTTGTQDEIGIQTEKRLIKEYDQVTQLSGLSVVQLSRPPQFTVQRSILKEC